MVGIVRMAADRGPDPVEFFRHADRVFRRRQIAADVHHCRHAVLPHPGENIVKIRLKARIVQMRMGIKIHRYASCSCWESQMSSTAISLGETPEMRPACPMERGLISLSFCRASTRRPVMEK